jgi:hypothetical protein
METAQLLKILLSWAVTLSSYPATEQLPGVEYISESYFHEHACGGKPCSILAWSSSLINQIRLNLGRI